MATEVWWRCSRLSEEWARRILHALLDKYERSSQFVHAELAAMTDLATRVYHVKQGDSHQSLALPPTRNITLKMTVIVPDYASHDQYELFRAVNEAVEFLERRSLITATRNRAHVIQRVTLQQERVDEAGQWLGRDSRAQLLAELSNVLANYEQRNAVLARYAREQRIRLATNKYPQFFADSLAEYEHVLLAVDEMLKLQSETYVREFSARVFKDSKQFERISGKVAAFLREYSDESELYRFSGQSDEDRDWIFSQYNVLKTPSYVNLKGTAQVMLSGQQLDLTNIAGDLAFSSGILEQIERIHVTGSFVMTVENLTAFHMMPRAPESQAGCYVYLGGFHNRVRRRLLKLLAEQNPTVRFYHFGDIDAGGFLILRHLREATGIDFRAWRMDVETLKAHESYWRSLTTNDRTRLQQLLHESESSCDLLKQLTDTGYDEEVIRFMLLHDCKLEQELIAHE
jgi:hypothetical protein